MDLIPNNEIKLNATFTSNPIGEIIENSMIIRDMPLEVRTRFIAELITKIDKVYDQGEETFARNSFLGVASTFGMLGAIATSSALNPIAGLLLSGAAVVSWGGSMYETFNENLKIEPLKDKLLRLSLALKSAPTIDWAALWMICGENGLFVHALEAASTGEIKNGKLDKKELPLEAAVDLVASYKGKRFEEIWSLAKNTKEGQQLPLAKPITQQYQMPSPAPQPPIYSEPQSLRSDARRIEASSAAEYQETIESEVFQEPLPTKLQEPVTLLQQYPSGDIGLNTKDIVDLILACVNSLAFIGGQRCGKSLLMAIASRIGLTNGKFNGVFVISSLAKKGEDDHYWAHCQTKTFFDLAVIVDKTPYYEEFLNTIRKFKETANAQNPQLLIIDEFPFLCERLEDDIKQENVVALDLMNELANIGSVVASGGAKRGWYVWLGSPKGAIGGMGKGGKVMKNFTLCYAAVAPESTVDSNGVHVSWDSNLFAATKLNFPGLKEPARGIARDLSDRIVFFNGKWYAKTKHDLKDLPVPQHPTKAVTPVAVITEDALAPQERAELQTAVALKQGQKKTQADILIERIEASQSATLEGFIIRELGCADKLEEMLKVIPAMLETKGRKDLLGKFQ